MVRRAIWTMLAVAAISLTTAELAQAQQPAPINPAWAGYQNSTIDWNRFYHYPYVYYPHNYWGREYFRSSNSLYYRYPAEMRIPVYNKKWQNYLPAGRPYHWGHHFILDQL